MGAIQGLRRAVDAYNQTALILRIAVGIVAGIALAFLIPGAGWIGMLGDLFVGALRAIAPLLVFLLVISALSQGGAGFDRRFSMVIFFYLLTTFLAAFLAVIVSFLFPVRLVLAAGAEGAAAPSGIAEVLGNLLMTMIANPLASIIDGRYLGILFWAVVFGIALKSIAADSTKTMFANMADSVSQTVRWIINLAPFGIMGLVFSSVSSYGIEIFTTYGQLVLSLVGCMLFAALVVNPIVVAVALRCNPYPLLFRCLRESGLTAFFTRSSAANIPVNMSLCEKLGLDKDMYSVSIPLGATINMDGAAITITIMTLAAVHTLGIPVDLITALVLSVLATLAACGASGVAGGSLLLIPMACSLFGISNDISMQVVGVGFIIGVVQDSMETALNSSSDVLFTATAEYVAWKKAGKPLPKKF